MWALGSSSEISRGGIWGVGWDINGLAGAHDQLFVPKDEFDLALEEG
jgi:hypothetical protein